MNKMISQTIDHQEAQISGRNILSGFIETDPNERPPREELQQQCIDNNIREEDAKTLAETAIGKANLKMTSYPKPLANRVDEVTFGLDNSKISLEKAFEILTTLGFSDWEKGQDAIDAILLTGKAKCTTRQRKLLEATVEKVAD
jgi:hypothetical protein